MQSYSIGAARWHCPEPDTKPGVYNHNGVAGRYFYRSPTGSFGITQPLNGESATHGNGSTLGFTMDSPEQAGAGWTRPCPHWHSNGV